MIERIWTNGKSLLLGLLFFLVSYGIYLSFVGYSNTEKQVAFQEKFQLVEKGLLSYSNTLQAVLETPPKDLWNEKSLWSKRFGVLILENQDVLFWNENRFPIHSFSFDKLGTELRVDSLSNGYYLIHPFTTSENHQVVVYSLLQSNYPYENSYLTSYTNEALSLPYKLNIYTAEKNGLPIYFKSKSKHPALYITPPLKTSLSQIGELIIFVFYIFSVILCWNGIQKLLKRTIPSKVSTGVFVVVFTAFAVAFPFFQFPGFIYNLTLFEPSIYASSSWFPSFGQMVWNSLVITYSAWWFSQFLKQHPARKKSLHTLFTVLIFLLFYSFAFYISWLLKSFILNSSVSLEVDEIFSLSIFSVLFLTLIAALFLNYFLLYREIISRLYQSSIVRHKLVYLWFFSGIIYGVLMLLLTDYSIYSAFWPLMINGVLFLVGRKEHSLKAAESILLLSLFSGYAAISINENTQINERQKREIYAAQLITEQDPILELEFLGLQERISDFFANTKKLYLNAPRVFSNTLVNETFSSYWDSYDIRFYLFNAKEQPLLEYSPNEEKTFDQLETVINEHTTIAELSSELFIVNDYFDQLSYISKQELIFSDNTPVWLFIEFRSKKIPEELGLPRLLINKTANVLDDLEEYSIARYANNNLVMRFGEINYPLTFQAFNELEELSSLNHHHYIRENDKQQVIIISKAEKTIFEKLTSFSYLLLFFGTAFFLTTSIYKGWIFFPTRQLLLSSKIQWVLISTVMGSFIIYSIISGQFVKQQHEAVTNDHLRERLSSVEIELLQKLGNQPYLDVTKQGVYLDQLLTKFAAVFSTDINLYGLDGSLLASSQPTIYEKGINGILIDPFAFYALRSEQKSEFIHKERIGKLDYLSAYRPLINQQNKTLGFLNLQHFAKQSSYENQINGFLITIINVAVLLLVITVIIAIFISNSIIAPLKKLQASVKTVELGKENKPIDYRGNDEIGALVKQYNDKLAELELKALQLAKSERETAWREMAKQVAHEIKNPLTPMKLSLQHFQRSFDSSAPDAKEKIQKITASLVEQIDALSHIANEFSNFAKMPKANEHQLDLLPLLTSCVLIFENNTTKIPIETELSEALVFADHDLMIRVFNNILKNAFQSIPDDRTANIKITLIKEEDNYVISISDNGTGISEEQRPKIFVPNFTTKTTGSGIGLAMVKQIVNNHRGEIWFESEEGVGTQFFVQLPVYKEESRS